MWYVLPLSFDRQCMLPGLTAAYDHVLGVQNAEDDGDDDDDDSDDTDHSHTHGTAASGTGAGAKTGSGGKEKADMPHLAAIELSKVLGWPRVGSSTRCSLFTHDHLVVHALLSLQQWAEAQLAKRKTRGPVEPKRFYDSLESVRCRCAHSWLHGHHQCCVVLCYCLRPLGARNTRPGSAATCTRRRTA